MGLSAVTLLRVNIMSENIKTEVPLAGAGMKIVCWKRRREVRAYGRLPDVCLGFSRSHAGEGSVMQGGILAGVSGSLLAEPGRHGSEKA